MSQLRDTKYHSQDTSAVQNRQLAGIVRPGVFSGYKLRKNAADTSQLDLTSGSDSTSVLVTTEGVRVEETATIQGVVSIDPPDANFKRFDAVIAEFQFSTDNSIEQTYSVIRGAYNGTDPQRPDLASDFQTLLAYVAVEAGTSQAAIDTDDIFHVEPAIDARAPVDVSSLAPIVEPSDTSRVFVYAGSFPSRDGSQRIVFGGGYSDQLDKGTTSNGDTLWYLLGVSDDGAVVVMGTASTEAGLPALTDENLIVGAVRATNVADVMVVQEIVDYRFVITRNLRPTIEEETYKSTLGDSVFQHLKVDLFRDSGAIDLTTISDTDVTAVIDQGDTSLTLTYTGGGAQPSADVTIATKNLLLGTSIDQVQHLMVVADTATAGITVDVSPSSATQGFTTVGPALNTIIRIPSGPASKIHLRFTVPATAFVGGAVKIFSYGAFMALDENVLNAATQDEVGLNSVKNSLSNLIANGNFKHWSRDDVNGNTPDPDLQQTIDYTVSADSPFAADGWQFTGFNYDGQVSRVGLSKDVLSTGISNPSDTALSWVGDGGGSATNILEYRVPVAAGLGKRVTFGCKHQSNVLGTVAVGVALYELTDDKQLVTQGTIAVTSALTTEGDLVVTSDIEINEATAAVGFLIYLTQTTGVSTTYLWNARAAIGDFRVLPFTEAVNSTDVLRKYYERGRIYVSTTAGEADIVGGSVQMGSQKHSAIGTIEAGVSPFSDSNRSVNLDVPTFSATKNSLVVEAAVISTGLVLLDIDFEVSVRYVAAT